MFQAAWGNDLFGSGFVLCGIKAVGRFDVWEDADDLLAEPDLFDKPLHHVGRSCRQGKVYCRVVQTLFQNEKTGGSGLCQDLGSLRSSR